MAAAPEFNAETLPIDEIFIVGERRPLDEGAVARLMESIFGKDDQGGIGLQVPITVRPDDDIPDPDTGEPGMGGYALVAGHHRLEAYRRHGETRIPVIIRDWNEIEAELWEISENLHRAELTALERDQQVARWVELSALRISAQSGPKMERGRPESGINAASRELGIERKVAQRAVKVASLSEEAKQAAREVGLDDNRTALLTAAREGTPEAQVQRLHEISDAKRRAKQADTKSLKEEAEEKVAELLAEHIPGEQWSALKANLHTAGCHRIAKEFDRLTGVSVFDNTAAARNGAAQ